MTKGLATVEYVNHVGIFGHSCFVIRTSFVIRDSGFVIPSAPHPRPLSPFGGEGRRES
jgi:hypothetical protein